MTVADERQGVDHRALPVFEPGEIDLPVRIHGMSERLERETAWAPHSHATHELLWNERGASTATIDSRVWTITPSLGLWIPAGVLHTGYASSTTWYRTAHFTVSGQSAVAPIATRPVAVDITPLLRLLLERLVDEALAPDSRLLTEQMILDVLAPSDTPLLVTSPTSALLRPIAAALEADPGDARALGDWAAELGVSARTITRAFVAETGLAFSRWQAALRAQRAVMLLGEGEPLDDVARGVGYASTSAFGAAFRRTTGRTPAQFR
ncbi:MAG: AraC family transcriptional regulator [Microbacterium sp.]